MLVMTFFYVCRIPKTIVNARKTRNLDVFDQHRPKVKSYLESSLIGGAAPGGDDATGGVKTQGF